MTETELVQKSPEQLVRDGYEVTKERIHALGKEHAHTEIENKKDMDAVMASTKVFRDIRVRVEKKRKVAKHEALEYGRMVDSVAKELTESLLKYEEPLKALRQDVDDKKAAEEKAALDAEEARLAKIDKLMDSIRAPLQEIYSTAAEVQEAIRDMLVKFVPAVGFEERAGEAKELTGFVLAKLERTHSNLLAEEEKAADMEAQRVEQEAEAKRLKAAADKLKAKEAELAAEQAEKAAEIKAVEEALDKRQKIFDEREREAAELKAKVAREAAAELEAKAQAEADRVQKIADMEAEAERVIAEEKQAKLQKELDEARERERVEQERKDAEAQAEKDAAKAEAKAKAKARRAPDVRKLSEYEAALYDALFTIPVPEIKNPELKKELGLAIERINYEIDSISP